MTPEVEWLLGQFRTNAAMVRSGAALFGPVAGDWPAWFADAVEVLSGEQSQADAVQGIGMESAYAISGLSRLLMSRR